jgi:lathosterol oxidase
MNHLLVQLIVWATMAPALWLLAFSVGATWQSAIQSQPLGLQFIEALVVADFAQYWIHRLFHRVPALWRFHAVHHSSEEMDWLAGSRLHLVDIVVTRAVAFAPLYLLGFEESALRAYLVFVSFQAVFNHTNFRLELRNLGYVLVTPQFHHWHHAIPAEAPDKNFAAHVPVLDWLFGTYHRPRGRWPRRYGCPDDRQPLDWTRQFARPFLRRTESA